MSSRTKATVGLLVIVVLVSAPGVWAGQMPVAPPLNRAPVSATSAENGQIHLLVGRSAVLNVESPITRVSLTTPDIADALVTAPLQLLIHGKAPGTISLFVWDRAGGIKTYEVVVRRDLSVLGERLQQLFPGESIGVAATGKDVVISGTVTSKYVVEKAADVAAGFVEKPENVVNLLRQQEGVASNQILLRVRFAEVSRSAMQELGASFFSDGNHSRFGSVTTQQFATPFFDQKNADLGKTLVFSDYLNLFLFDAKNQIGGVIKALQNRGLFQSLAEPNLIAQNGREASFLAGGEFPYPVVQGAGQNVAISIQFKEFGVRLNFTPTVLAEDLIHLKVRPEVSALDFNNAVTLQGFRIPALSTRRTETEVELQDGQTFAIAGLLNNSVTSSMSKVPGIGDIPIVGLLFRSRAYQKAETELVVMITPQILRRGSTGAAAALPTLVEPFLGVPNRRLSPPLPFVGSPKYPTGSQTGDGQPETRIPDTSPASTNTAGDRSAASTERPRIVSPPITDGASASVDATPAGVDRSIPASSASSVMTPQPSATPAPPRELTKAERKALERAEAGRRKAEEQEAKRKAEEARVLAEAETARRRQAEKEAQQKEKLAQEQARRDAERKKKEEKTARQTAEREAKRAKSGFRRSS